MTRLSVLASVVAVVLSGCGLPEGEAELWPERFISAIKPGADLTGVMDNLFALNRSERNVYVTAGKRADNLIKILEETT